MGSSDLELLEALATLALLGNELQNIETNSLRERSEKKMFREQFAGVKTKTRERNDHDRKTKKTERGAAEYGRKDTDGKEGQRRAEGGFTCTGQW